MGERHEQLKETLRRDHEEMRALFEQLTPEMLRRPATDGWTVGKLAGHVAVSPRGLMFILGRLRKGSNVQVPKPLQFIVNVRNWWSTRAFSNPTREQLLAELDASHAALAAYIDGLSDEELDRGGQFLDNGYQTVFENAQFSTTHTREHAADLRKGAGLATLSAT